MSGAETPTAPEGRPYHVPRLLRAAEALCADGRQLRGRVFLPASDGGHAGAVRADEWLNEAPAFFPFLPDGEGRPIILNKHELVLLTVAASADQDEASGLVAGPLRSVVVECAGQRLEGELLIDMPENHLRVLDLLNRSEAFLTVRAGDRHHLVRKARITCVVERPGAARSL